MSRAVTRTVTPLLLLAALAGCGGPADTAPSSAAPTTSQAAPSSATAAALPAQPQPTADGPCPYLDNRFVADANGQLVNHVRTSPEQPHPTCFFYGNPKDVQLTTRVYVGDPAVAKALVDQAAPVSSSNPADQPTGWSGGSLVTDQGAVYAVAKGGAAIIVTTDQKQTVKARRVTETIAANLHL
jgi:hypothetical protein